MNVVRPSSERPSDQRGSKHVVPVGKANELVVEVRYDHVDGDRFRHGTGLMRWRPDKRHDNVLLTNCKSRCARKTGRRYLSLTGIAGR